MKLKLGMLFIEKFLTMLWPKKKKILLETIIFGFMKLKIGELGNI